MIKLNNVSIQFGQQLILDRISLDLQIGQMLALLGPSGSGKSTLLKAIAGLIPYQTGSILIEDSDHRAWLRENAIGMLFQMNALFDSMTVADNLRFPLRETTSLNSKSIEEKIRYYLAEVELSESANKYPEELSGGMKKRLGIARMLALEPRLLFYDDPTAGLDPVTSQKIISLISLLQQRHSSTLILVSHEMAQIKQLSCKMAVITNQKIQEFGDFSAIFSHQDQSFSNFICGRS